MRLRIVFSSLMVAVAVAMTGCGLTGGANLPPASRLMEPGPGVGGPGPGVLASPTPGVAPASYMSAGYGAGMTAGYGGYQAGCLPGDGGMVGQESIQVLFAKPDAMQVAFDAGGGAAFNSVPMITPARQNFFGGGIYRLKLTGIPGREGTELYPTLEIAPASNRSRAYLAHNAIPVQFTEEDFDQVLSGNFVTKVIYLPDPDFQELALAGVETLVSTRLDPGLDPIEEARRRGAILGVVRIGNKDIEIPGGESPMVGVYAANRQPAGSGVIPAGAVAPVPAAAVAPMPMGTVAPASFGAACSACGGGPCTGGCMAGPEAFYGPNSTPRGGFGPGGLPPGLTGGGQYGMPITGTPIGLPGPPHVPLGVPAGLKKHVMHNWTKRHIPDPVKKLKINVKQRPGLSYPQPASRAWVVEDTIHSAPHYSHKHFGTAPAVGGPVGVGGSTQAGSKGLIHEMKGLFGKHH